MGKRSLPSRDSLRALLSDTHDVDATLDLGKAKRVGGVFWLIGGGLALVMLPFAPPTEAIGWPGWLVSALCLGVCLAVAARRFNPRVIPSVDEIFLSGWLGLAAIVALEWLAGGRSSPYDQLLFLPATYAAAVHGGWRAAGFLTAVILAAFLPLLYDDVPYADTVRLATQVLLLLALALTARVLILTLRVQRGKLMRASQQAEGLARRDSLTGLGNRRAFQEALTREVARAKRSDGSLSVLLGDVKNFKSINDSPRPHAWRRVPQGRGAAPDRGRPPERGVLSLGRRRVRHPVAQHVGAGSRPGQRPGVRRPGWRVRGAARADLRGGLPC